MASVCLFDGVYRLRRAGDPHFVRSARFSSLFCSLFLAFGITGLAAVPALFVLGVQSFAGARELAGRALSGKKGVFPFGRAYWVRCALCAGAVALSAVLEYWAVPALLCSVAGLF